MPTFIDPKRIRTDLDTQSRIALNEETVREYAEAMAAGTVFPAIRVFYDAANDMHVLADGFHRLAAYMQVKPDEPIAVELTPGTLEDAQWESIGANKSHGLRRTNEDKRNAVKQALLHPKGATLSNVKIAEHVGVSHTTVQNIRKELEATCKICKSETRTGQDGRVIHTEHIGSGKTAPPPGSTCAICRLFEQSTCQRDGSQPIPWEHVCEEFESRDETSEGDSKAKRRKRNPNQYRHLKGCETLFLPVDNPQLFAVELRNYFPAEYLFDCMKVLEHLLTDKGD